MGLDQPLADRQAEASRSERALLAVAAGQAGVLAEQVRQPLRRHAPALVRDRDGDVDALAHRGDPDGRGLRGVPGGVGEQVVQHLDDAPAVGQRARQVRRQIDQHAVPAAAAQEGVPGPLHQVRDLRRIGGYRERARVDAPNIQQVADQPAHVIGLLVDDAEELAHLGRVELRFGAQRGRGRSLDRGQRRAQPRGPPCPGTRPAAAPAPPAAPGPAW